MVTRDILFEVILSFSTVHIAKKNINSNNDSVGVYLILQYVFKWKMKMNHLCSSLANVILHHLRYDFVMDVVCVVVLVLILHLKLREDPKKSYGIMEL